MSRELPEHTIPFNIFMFVVLVLCVSMVMLVADYSDKSKSVNTMYVKGNSEVLQLPDVILPVPKQLGMRTFEETNFYSFSMSDISGMITGSVELFVIGTTPESSIVTSNYPGWASSANLFDFVGDEMFVVNSQNNSVDVFSMQDTKAFYSRSLQLPQYETGLLYAISCSSEDLMCELNTAFHFESGCQIVLDLETEEFEISGCGGAYTGGTFMPEPRVLQ